MQYPCCRYSSQVFMEGGTRKFLLPVKSACLEGTSNLLQLTFTQQQNVLCLSSQFLSDDGTCPCFIRNATNCSAVQHSPLIIFAFYRFCKTSVFADLKLFFYRTADKTVWCGSSRHDAVKRCEIKCRIQLNCGVEDAVALFETWQTTL